MRRILIGLWDLQPDYDFGKYQEGIKFTFNNWDVNLFDNPSLWDTLKSKFFEIDTKTIGAKNVKGNYKLGYFIDQAIKNWK